MSDAFRVIRIFVSHTGEMSDYADRVRKLVDIENGRWEREHKVTVRIITFRDMSSEYSNTGVQDLVNRFVKDQYDFYVGLMGQKFGTKTSKFGSGTEEEYKTAVDTFKTDTTRIKQILFGFCETPVNPFSIDLKGFSNVKKFRSEMQKNQLYFSWDDSKKFEEIIRDQITKVVFKYVDNPKNVVLGGARYE